MDAKTELLAWTSISLLCGIVIINAAYRAQGGRIRQILEESTSGILGSEVGLFVFMIGIPFAAVITGATSLDLMALGTDLVYANALGGFSFISWLSGIGVTAIVVSGILAVLWLTGRISPHGEPWSIGLVAIRDAFYNEVHWTFYRTAPALWLNAPYWGTVIGFILVLIEWIAQPNSWVWVNSLEGRQHIVLRLACMISSGMLYLATQNLWLMILADVIVQLVGSRVLTTYHRQLTVER